jgi:hypothetical protein
MLPVDPSILALATLSALIVGVSAVLLLVRRQKKQTSERTESTPPDDDREVIRVFYGTQTGTAEKFAKELTSKLVQRYCERKCFRVQDIEKYDHESSLSTESFLIYLVATYGDGEPTDNTTSFHQWLEPKAEAVFAGDAPQILEVRRTIYHMSTAATCSALCSRPCVWVLHVPLVIHHPRTLFTIEMTPKQNLEAAFKRIVANHVRVIAGHAICSIRPWKQAV